MGLLLGTGEGLKRKTDDVPTIKILIQRTMENICHVSKRSTKVIIIS